MGRTGEFAASSLSVRQAASTSYRLERGRKVQATGDITSRVGRVAVVPTCNPRFCCTAQENQACDNDYQYATHRCLLFQY